jgi:ATP:corrinoid adenosyltransferase
MLLHTKAFAKVIVAASALGEVTTLWAHHTQVTLGQFLKAGIAITLGVALFRHPVTVTAADVAGMAEFDSRAQERVQVQFVVANGQIILDGVVVFANKFLGKSAHGSS